MRSLSRFTKSFSTKKGQFFILSVFVLVTMMYMISRWMEPVNILDTSYAALMEEPYIFNNIVEKAIYTVNTTKECQDLRYNLEEYKTFCERYVLDKGMSLNITYQIVSCVNYGAKRVVFSNITLVSNNMKLNRTLDLNL